jgi:flagellar biosynthetic protein FliR
MTITDAALAQLIDAYCWTFARIAALVMAAPVLGSTVTPPRVRLMLSLVLTMVLAPLVSHPAAPGFLAPGWWLALLREILIGAGLGVLLRLVFEAVMLAGELVSYGMGLGFAQLADPLHGAAAPMLGQFYQVSAVLLFLTLGGHLQLAALLMDSFRVAPSASALPPASVFSVLAMQGTAIFAGAVQTALSAVIALLLVNLGFGVINRSSPAMNALSIGFPISLIVGLLVLRFVWSQVNTSFELQLASAWSSAAGWMQLWGGRGG